ncbi:aldo/keto reductase [Spongiactinospora sp. 9N601]|uniref:aldo/keto reductase n=1 Tax=Spongiactinospora sp. 9N601 TaxID=3375149 RepID=UPI00379D0EBC
MEYPRLGSTGTRVSRLRLGMLSYGLYKEEEREMNPLCLDQGVGLLAWNPLARGLPARAGKPEAATARAGGDARIDALYDPEGDRPILDRVAEVAREREVPPAQVAPAWLLAQQGVTAPVIGAAKIQHVDDAGLALTAEEIAHLAEPYRPRPSRV